LPADRLSSWSSRLKGGCGHDWPPHEEKYAALTVPPVPIRSNLQELRPFYEDLIKEYFPKSIAW